MSGATDGAIELMNLAHMLRLGAGVATEIAVLRPADASEIDGLAEEALGMAERIDRLLRRQLHPELLC